MKVKHVKCVYIFSGAPVLHYLNTSSCYRTGLWFRLDWVGRRPPSTPDRTRSPTHRTCCCRAQGCTRECCSPSPPPCSCWGRCSTSSARAACYWFLGRDGCPRDSTHLRERENVWSNSSTADIISVTFIHISWYYFPHLHGLEGTFISETKHWILI